MEPINIEARKKVAITAIKSAFGTPEQEYGVTMFAEHHIEELEPEYWMKHLGVKNPGPKEVLDLLVLREHWDEDRVFDFTLPEDVTDYVISVQFDDNGEVEDITMES